MNLRDSLQAIYDEHGLLTPALVVEAARPRSHPLHGRVFDRAPAQAAEAWYQHRAHELIQSVRVRYEVGDEVRDVRAYVAVRQADSHQPHYTPVADVVQDEFAWKLVLQDMEREWRTLRRRYDHFQEFGEIVLRDLHGEQDSA